MTPPIFHRDHGCFLILWQKQRTSLNADARVNEKLEAATTPQTRQKKRKRIKTMEKIKTKWLVSVKPIRSWCFWHHDHENGLRAIQIGPIIIEIWRN